MKTESLEPIVRIIVREVACGLSDGDICINHPEYKPVMIAKMRAGKTFKRALREMQEAIDLELVEQAGGNAVRQFLGSKSLVMAQTLAGIAEDAEAPEAVRVKAADSVLAKAGYAGVQEQLAVPILMLSPAKLAAITGRPNVLANVPDCVDGQADNFALPT